MYYNKMYAALLMFTLSAHTHLLLPMKGKAELLAAIKTKPALIKMTVAATGLFAAGCVYAEHQEKKLRFIDISTPSNLKIIEPLVRIEQAQEDLTHSVTKRQFEQDWYYTYAPVATLKAQGSQKYLDRVDATLFSHFWLFLPTARKRLTALVQQLSHDEHNEHRKGNLTFVHGTSQGGSMLLRTIFSEVIEEKDAASSHNFVKLRNDTTMGELQQYQDVHAYYDANLNKAPRTRVLQRVPGFGPMATNEYIIHFDKGPAQKHLLAMNLGFFGKNCWWRDGYKESSADFVTRPSSWAYQALDVLTAGYSLGPFGGLVLLGFMGLDLVKNPKLITAFPALLDKHIKGFSNSNLMEKAFKEYGSHELYEKYRDELNAMESLADAGLLQLFIKKDAAKKYCYVSEALGIRVTKAPYMLEELEDPKKNYALWAYQARAWLHSELCEQKNSSMRFYLLGKPEEIQEMTTRLYEIAQEVKEYNMQKNAERNSNN